MLMDYQIRKSAKADMGSVLKLIKELAEFEKEAHQVEISVDDLIRDGFGENAMFTCYLAETKEGIIGAALCYNRYSTWKGKTLHLEDLIVSEAFRGKGIGKALYTRVLEHAWNQGVKRVEWNVLDWNSGAIDFYESTGAKVLRDWDTVQMNYIGLKSYLSKK